MPHAGMKDATMWSPFFTCGTSLPTSSTVPAPSWPRTVPGMIGDVAVLDRQVGVADAAGAELDDDVLGSGRRGLDVLDCEWPTGFDEDCGPHSGPPLC